MEIIDTTVSDGGSHRTMRLLGQGGESVSVTLTAREEETDDEFIARAKAMLVQAGTFTEEMPTDRPDHLRPERYALEYLDKGEVRIMPGVELPSLEALQEEVMRSARDLWTDALSRQEAPTGWAVRARDASGEIVASVDFEEIQQSMNDEEASAAAT